MSGFCFVLRSLRAPAARRPVNGKSQAGTLERPRGFSARHAHPHLPCRRLSAQTRSLQSPPDVAPAARAPLAHLSTRMLHLPLVLFA